MTLGARVSIELKDSSIVIIAILLTMIITVMLIAKILEIWFDFDSKKLTITSVSAILYSIFTINMLNIVKLVYNMLNYKDIILSNRYVSIRFFYTKEELISLIPILHKHLLGTARIFNPIEQKNILKDATSVQELKKNLEDFLIKEQVLKNNKWVWLETAVSFCQTHPIIIIAIAGGLSLVLGISLYKQYSNIIHWHQANQNIREVNNQLQNSYALIIALQSRIKRLLEIINIHDNNLRFTNHTIGRIITALGAFFQIGFEINEKGGSVNFKINKESLSKLLSRLIDIKKDNEKMISYVEENIQP